MRQREGFRSPFAVAADCVDPRRRRSGRRGDLVARALVVRRVGRVHRRPLALGLRGDRTQPAVGCRTGFRVADGDRASSAAAARGLWATLVGTVFAHRVFDLVPVLALIVYVLLTAKIPQWAVTSLAVVAVVGVALLVFAFASAKDPNRSPLDGLGAARRLVTMARHGLGVMKTPLAAAEAVLFQVAGWMCQLLAVWAAMRAFHIHQGLPAAGLVLVLMNVATIFPLWPGNVGLLQAAVALPLFQYGVSYARGFAFGIGLQAIEASVGVGFGLLFLAREGLSFAMLKRMPDAAQAEVPEEEDDASDRSSGEPERGLVGGRRR